MKLQQLPNLSPLLRAAFYFILVFLNLYLLNSDGANTYRALSHVTYRAFSHVTYRAFSHVTYRAFSHVLY